MSDSFTPKLGRIGWKQGTRLDRYINQVMRAAQSAGQVYGRGRAASRDHILGAAPPLERWLRAGLYPGRQRRVIVKARITKFKAGDLGAARAHLRYIQRDGVTPREKRVSSTAATLMKPNGTAFLDECEEDRHQFRLIVSPEDGAQLARPEALHPGFHGASRARP